MISLSNTHYNIKTANGNTKIIVACFLIENVGSSDDWGNAGDMGSVVSAGGTGST